MERSVCYVNTCLECERKGEQFVYWGETSSSAYERSIQHIREGERCQPRSHIFQHIIAKHPEGISSIKRTFQFRVVERFSSAFHRQIGEALLIKNSTQKLMNNKLEYSRCIVPEIGQETPWKLDEDAESRRIRNLQMRMMREGKEEVM